MVSKTTSPVIMSSSPLLGGYSEIGRSETQKNLDAMASSTSQRISISSQPVLQRTASEIASSSKTLSSIPENRITSVQPAPKVNPLDLIALSKIIMEMADLQDNEIQQKIEDDLFEIAHGSDSLHNDDHDPFEDDTPPPSPKERTRRISETFYGGNVLESRLQEAQNRHFLTRAVSL